MRVDDGASSLGTGAVSPDMDSVAESSVEGTPAAESSALESASHDGMSHDARSHASGHSAPLADDAPSWMKAEQLKEDQKEDDDDDEAKDTAGGEGATVVTGDDATSPDSRTSGARTSASGRLS